MISQKQLPPTFSRLFKLAKNVNSNAFLFFIFAFTFPLLPWTKFVHTPTINRLDYTLLITYVEKNLPNYISLLKKKLFFLKPRHSMRNCDRLIIIIILGLLAGRNTNSYPAASLRSTIRFALELVTVSKTEQPDRARHHWPNRASIETEHQSTNRPKQDEKKTLSPQSTLLIPILIPCS